MALSKKQVFLHIGTPKTGTSALQKFLVENRSKLEKQGVSYPSHALGDHGISSGNGQEIVNIALNKGVDAARKYFESLVKGAKAGKVLISTEAFYSHPEIVYQIAPSAKIIVYFRNQLDLVESSYNQSVKRAGQQAPFSTALRRVMRTKEQFYTGELVLRWVELFGKDNVIFRKYEEESFRNFNIYDDFLSVLEVGYDDGFTRPTDKVNPSYCMSALDYKRCLNALASGRQFPYMREVDVVLQGYSNEYFKSGGKKYSLYSPKELKEADSFFEPYRQEIANTFGEVGRLFRENYSLIPYSAEVKSRIKSISEITDLLIEKQPAIAKILASLIAQGLSGDSALAKRAAIELSPLLNRSDFYEVAWAESQGLSFDNQWFTDQQLSMMAKGKYREPDYLRDIAIIADRRDNTKLAHELIFRALTLRPNGPKIVELEKDFRKKLSS